MTTVLDCNDTWLTDPEATRHLKLKPGTLAVWRSTGRYPDLPYTKCGRSVRYRRADLDGWLEKRTIRAATPD